jgi:hypothetical protein
MTKNYFKDMKGLMKTIAFRYFEFIWCMRAIITYLIYQNNLQINIHKGFQKIKNVLNNISHKVKD